MNLLKSFFLLALTLCFSVNSEATHVMGSDIFYRHISNLKYEIIIKFYRDCNGVAFANPSSSTRIKCVNGSGIPLSLSLKSIKNITPVCSSVSTPCNPQNTFGTGSGFEEHTFVDTIDFSQSTYSDLLSCSGNIIIETGQCCRNSGITTGPANENFYSYAEMSFDIQNEHNSSPVFEIPPVFETALNQPISIALGAMDTVDYDSLSYSFGNPLKGYNTSTMFNSGFSTNKPFSAYWPAGTSYPFSNPNATPPIGIHLDSTTGVLSATPVAPNEVAVLVIEVKEWRKNSSGTMDLISTTRRDAQFIVATVANNNTPKITMDTLSLQQYGSNGCVSFVVKDEVVIPPPPAPIPNHDTLQVKLVGNDSHLTFTIDSTVYGVSRKTTAVYGKVCYDSVWSTKGSNTIYLYARDNNCPFNAEVSKGGRINFTSGTASLGQKIEEGLHFDIYPNPANSILYIDLAKLNNQIKIALIDATGKTVLESFDSYNQHISLIVKDLPKGVYFLRLETENGQAAKRIIIQ